MSIKKILAAASASIVAVSAMAVTSLTSFAEDFPNGGWESPIMTADDLTDIPCCADIFTKDVDVSVEIKAVYGEDSWLNGWVAVQGGKGNDNFQEEVKFIGNDEGQDWILSVDHENIPNGDTVSIDFTMPLTDKEWFQILGGNDGGGFELVQITLSDSEGDLAIYKDGSITAGREVEEDPGEDDNNGDSNTSDTTSTPATEEKAPTSLKDDGSKIETTFKEGVFAAGTKIAVKEDKTQSGDDKVAFDISFTDKDGKEVQPNGEVSVSIPVPASFKDVKTLYVFHVENDGKYTEVKSEVKDGKITFTAKAFSTFVISTKDLNAPAASTDSTPKIKPADQQNVPAIGEGPADQRPVPSIGYKDGTTNNGGNNGGNSGNSGSDNKPADPSKPSNPNTGVAIAFAPALLAGAAVVVAKKRK